MKPIKRRSTVYEFLVSKNLHEASEDFRYLLNRAYSRKAALELVGNRYQLTSDQRHLLHRGVFSDVDSTSRQKKKIPFGQTRGKDLVIDGYNVLITIEAALSGRPLILGDDGFLRDISGVSRNFRKTEKTGVALQLLIRMLKKVEPHRTLFLFDSPMSRSGELAQEVRDRMKKVNLPGDALAVGVPEKILIGFPGRVATSDTAIIDRSQNVVDLAGSIITNPSFRRLKSAATNSTHIIRWRRRRGALGRR